MKKKNIIVIVLLMGTMILTTSVSAFAKYDGAVIDYGRNVLFQNSMDSLVKIIGSDRIEELRLLYTNIFPDAIEADASFRDVIISIQMQAVANDFTDEQIMYMFAGYIETTRGAFTGDLMEWSDTPPVATHSRYFELDHDTARVELNGYELIFDQPAILTNGRVLVPLRMIFETLGADVEWNQDTQTAIATRGETVVKIQIGSPVFTVNGVDVELDVAPQIRNNRTLVPVRAVAEAFDADVTWLHRRNIVIITTP